MKTIKSLFALAAMLAMFGSTSFAADTPSLKPNTYSPPRTPEGKPDLQGIWSNNNATPLERPKMLQGRARLTQQEVDALRKRQEEIFAGDGDAAFGDAIFEAVLSDVQKYKPTSFDVSTGNYNAFWLVGRDFDDRTSLIVNPADGRMPAMTPAGQERLAKNMSNRNLNEGPESRSLSERCITFGVPDLLAGYNSYYQIVQTRDTVILLDEKIHDARVIPITNRPHSPSSVRSWAGDSRGHWEGDTLVVDTINLLSSFRGASDKLHLIEKFTRADKNTIHYEITIDDPATWTQKWTLMIPLHHTDDHIYEYACHEGNHGLAGILQGARAEERQAAQTK